METLEKEETYEEMQERKTAEEFADRCELERKILGMCMIERGAFKTANDLLDFYMFSFKNHMAIFLSMKAIYEENPDNPIDMITVNRKLEQWIPEGTIDPIELVNIVDCVHSAADLLKCCKKLILYSCKYMSDK